MSESDTLPAGGTVTAGFEGVRRAFLEGQANAPGGAQLCVYRHGERVVDLWAGRDPAGERPYGARTIGVLMSCTKGVVAGAVHMLAERGLVDFDAALARYWPEFANGAKDEITVRQALSHQAGLMGYDPEAGMGAAQLFDFDLSARKLAEMTPLWPPGGAVYYHFITFGVLAGELIRRVDGRSAGRFIAEEIAGPLGLDFWIGLPEAEEPRRAPHFDEGPQIQSEQWRAVLAGAGVDLESRLARAFIATVVSTDAAIALMNTSRAARAAELPAGNGVGDARALAKFYASLIGPVDGIRLIGEAAMEAARTPQTLGLGPPGELRKLARGEPQPFGVGFELPSAVKPMLGAGSFGHAGAGGRMGFAHPESGVSVGYACNAMLQSMTTPDPRWIGWTAAVREAIGL
ncbi:MAG: serine hydrolase domain-containing protein [Caulobacteraceae bacterium]